MENFIIAFLLIAIIAVFISINTYIICNVCEEMISLVESGDTASAKDLWDKKRGYIAVFVRDAEIDVVDAEMDKAEMPIANEDGEAENKNMALIDSIKELMNGEKPNFENIFIVDIRR